MLNTKSPQDRSSYEWGIFWMLLSATCLSVSILFLKINLDYLNYFFVLFLRFFVPLVCVLILIAIGWKWKELASGHIPLQLFRCLCVLVSQYGIAYYIMKNSLLNATVLLNSAPLFIPLIEWAFLGHRPGNSTIVGALLAFFGVILILHPDKSLFSLLSLVGLFAALGQAGSQVLYGMRSKSENLLASLFYLFFFTSVVSLLIFFFQSENPIEVQNGDKEIEWILIISLILMSIGTLLNQYFRGLAYRCGSPSSLTTFLYFAVFVSALFDWLIFKNTPTTLTIIGSCLIILAGVLKIFLRAHILKRRSKK